MVANRGVMAGLPVPSDVKRPGYREMNPVAILKVEDANGKTLFEYQKPDVKTVLSPQVAYLMTDVLSDNQARAVAFGANSPLKLSRPTAAKTGTTNDFKDNWTLGYTPQLVTGVWVGNSDNTSMERSSGLTGAGPIWHDFMEYALKDLPVENFQRPEGMVEVDVCAPSGLRPTPNCPSRVKELFIAGTEPKTDDNIWQAFRICKPSGKLATLYCPPDQIEDKVFAIYPPEAADWVRDPANNVPQPPTDYDTTYGPAQQVGDVAIIKPVAYGYVHGLAPVIGNAKAGSFNFYRLEFGSGLDPTAWTQIGGDHHNQVDGGQLEVWDTTGLADGLYTLQLTVVEGNGNRKQSSAQVNVDNKPPTVKLLNPSPNEIYIMEDKEWVNIQADARDNVSMDRVEFFLDGKSIGFNTVAPYTRRWTITMIDKPPVKDEPPVTKIEEVVGPDGIKRQVEVTVSEVISVAGQLIRKYDSGATVILDSGGYTETHIIHVVAYDAAGASTESPKVTIQVAHKPKKPAALLWRDQDWLALAERWDHRASPDQVGG
ncbi:MAG: hypothetical protein HYR71_02565 [Chloroflexi bacterium]|nr:hypothetical protein [Chloroflexota bacterium]